MSHSLFLSLVLAAAPVFIILWYFYQQDKHQPEPKRLVLKIFVLGVLSTIPLIFLDLYITSLELYLKMPLWFYNLLVSFFQTGFCEELIKLLVVLVFFYRHRKFDEVSDGIFYTITVSLGFACMENILYVVGKPVNVAIARALTAVPFHAVCSGVMGYYIGRAKFTKYRKLEIRFIRTGYLIAAVLHGAYDYLIYISPLFGSLYAIVIVPVIYLTYVRLKSHMKTAVKKDLKRRI